MNTDAYNEPSALNDVQSRGWLGLNLGIFDARNITGAVHVERPGLAMMLRGRTRARIRSRGRTYDFSPDTNSVGLFAPIVDIDESQWLCEPGSLRMVVDLSLEDLIHFDDLSVLRPAKRTLRQDVTLADPILAGQLRAIAAEVLAGSPNGRLFAAVRSAELLFYLFDKHGEGGRPTVRERGKLTLDQRSRVVDQIRDQLSEDISVCDLAATAGMSQFHFLRVFRSTMGITPHRFVIQMRLERARQLLRDSVLSLAQISSECGFSSQSHLSSAMRKYHSTSPAKLRAIPKVS